MNHPLVWMARGWWWGRWHPLVRIGWSVMRTNRSNTPTETVLGLGLIAGGVLLKTQRRRRIYSTTIPANGEIRIRVREGGTLIAGTGATSGAK